MQKLKVFKYIEIDGQDVPMESLTDEEKRRIAYALQDNLMQIGRASCRERVSSPV